MSVTLPSLPLMHSLNFFEVTMGGDLDGPFGAPVIRINRLGDRHGVNVGLPPFVMAECGGEWLGKLRRARYEKAKLLLPVPPDMGNSGTPLVKGGSQQGSELDIDGLTAGFVVKGGWKITLVTDGIGYMHIVTDDVTANGSGEATLNIFPMLRVTPDDNDTVEIEAPWIEGWITQKEWNEEWMGTIGLSFTLTEQK